MQLVEISEKEFKKVADKSPLISFHQTYEWANLKKENGWTPYYLALKDKKKIVSTSLILSKNIPVINKKMFYSPRGFLIDYDDEKLLKEWTTKIKEFAKEKNAIFIKIDPYLEYQPRDNNGEVVEGKDNKKAHNNLLKLGYKHFGFNKMQEELQPRWMHVIETKDRSIDDVNKDMESKTRQILRKNERSGIIVREIQKDELKTFKKIMESTSDRREFIDRPFSYYESMWDNLHDDGILKILIGEIDFDLFEKNTKDELKSIEDALKDIMKKHDQNLLKMNEKKYLSNNKNDEREIERLTSDLEKIEEYKKEFGNKKTLGGILFLVYGNEVLSLLGGTLDNVMKFKSAYTIHYAGVKYAVENNYDRYNFYGITGDFNENNPLYGLFLFKKSFGGHVVELLGEYDLIISKFWYHTYNIMFNTYHNLKKLKLKLKK